MFDFVKQLVKIAKDLTSTFSGFTNFKQEDVTGS